MTFGPPSIILAFCSVVPYIQYMTRKKTVPLDKLTEDPQNARIHSIENISTITESLKQFGAGRSIVVDKNGVVRAGNGTLQAAKDAGFEQVEVVKTDGKTLIAVQRDDWTAEEAAGYALVDNRAAELAHWDEEVLGKTISELKEHSEEMIPALGFDEKSLKDLFSLEENTENAIDNQEIQKIELKYAVLIDCENEQHQTDLLNKIQQEGLSCRALML